MYLSETLCEAKGDGCGNQSVVSGRHNAVVGIHMTRSRITRQAPLSSPCSDWPHVIATSFPSRSREALVFATESCFMFLIDVVK